MPSHNHPVLQKGGVSGVRGSEVVDPIYDKYTGKCYKTVVSPEQGVYCSSSSKNKIINENKCNNLIHEYHLTQYFEFCWFF